MSGSKYERVAEVFQALSSPQRIKILFELAEKPKKQLDLAKSLNLEGGALYHHIYVLIHAGLVRKVLRGMYELTELGYKLLDFIEESKI